jgi:hypothetical protein
MALVAIVPRRPPARITAAITVVLSIARATPGSRPA